MATTTVDESFDAAWRIPDALWERMRKVLAIYDPPARTGRPRIDQRTALDGILYRLRTGCQWNYLPAEFGWGASVYRTFRRWERLAIFDILWALLLIECEELGGIDWRYWIHGTATPSRAKGASPGKAGAAPITTSKWALMGVSTSNPPAVVRRASRRAGTRTAPEIDGPTLLARSRVAGAAVLSRMPTEP